MDDHDLGTHFQRVCQPNCFISHWLEVLYCLYGPSLILWPCNLLFLSRDSWPYVEEISVIFGDAPDGLCSDELDTKQVVEEADAKYVG